VNLPTMNLRTLVLATMAVSAVAFSQVPVSSNDGPYQIRYASNINQGDSFIDISNDGASMGPGVLIGSGTNTLAVNGSFCVNAYAFDAAEEILSCCSCPVTPNGLVSLSVTNDLLSNTLTGRGIPSSVVIKLVASTGATATSCTNSASLVVGGPAGNLVPGMVAWGTSLHANTSAPTSTYALTETPFTVASPNVNEIARVAQLCNFNQLQGTGFGICKSCEIGGLGASASNQ
jgi:hypothetical protein